MDPLGKVELQGQVEAFAQDMDELLRLSLPDMPATTIETLTSDDRYVVHVGADGKGAPLFVQGTELATLKAKVHCQLDFRKRYLAVHSSSMAVLANIDRTPIFRFDYLRDAGSVPNAHIHVHAHRGALSHLLSRADHDRPHDISALHIPVGGSRFRPALEDVVQFAIQECRFDHLPDWRETVEKARRQWRRSQVAASARALPEEAARALQELGYSVEPPTNLKRVSEEAYTHW